MRNICVIVIILKVLNKIKVENEKQRTKLFFSIVEEEEHLNFQFFSRAL